VGLDITTKYARVGACLREGAAVQYAMPLEGELETFHTVDLKAFGLDHVAQRTDFLQADVNNLDPKYSQYDFILASNILEFLYDPALFLSSVHERLRPMVCCACALSTSGMSTSPHVRSGSVDSSRVERACLVWMAWSNV